jgi:hypothetical protein
MTMKSQAAPPPQSKNSDGSAVDEFEQTWNRYIQALEEMRNLHRQSKEEITRAIGKLRAGGRVTPA